MNVTYESKAYDRDFVAQKKKTYVKILKREGRAFHDPSADFH